MLLLTAGLGLFIVPHFFREMQLRDALVSRLGEGAYKGLFSLLSLLGLGLIIYGKSRSEFIQIWTPLFDTRWVSLVIMFPSLVLVTAGNLPASALRTTFNHPMLLGVTLWALAHLWVNGDLASMLLFGGFGLWAVIKYCALPSRPSIAPNRWDAAALVIGCAGYVVLVLFHGSLFGAGIAL